MFGYKTEREKQEDRNKLKKELLDEIRAEQERKELEVKKAEEEAADEAKRIHEAAEKARKEEEERLKNSDEPWFVQVGSESKDKDNKGVVKVEYDWNDAWIKLLREHGYQGSDDETVIQHYLAVIAKRTAEDMAKDQLSEYE